MLDSNFGFSVRCLLFAAFATLALFTTPLSAQGTTAENKAAARALAIEGTKLADSGDCEGAVERLSRAEQLYHAPTILGRLGECQIDLGKLVQGSENLNRVVREPLARDAPAAFHEARDRARRVLEATRPRIANLTIFVDPKVEGLSVTVSGTPVPEALFGAARPTDPGTHKVLASAPGYLTNEQTVTLLEGQSSEVELQLVLDPNKQEQRSAHERQGEAEVTTAPPVAPPPEVEPTPPSRTLPYVLMGVGAAGLVFGGVSGLLAISKKGSLNCDSSDRCPPSEQSKLDSAETFALMSNIGFGLGLVSAGTGLVLLLVDSGRPASAPTDAARLQPQVGPGWLGLRGTF